MEEQKLEKIKKDASRYQWLASNLNRIFVTIERDYAADNDRGFIKSIQVLEHRPYTDKPSLDLAIDAAMGRNEQ